MDQVTEILGNIGFDLKLAIVHFVNFLVVFVILTKFVFKPLAARMKERNQLIEKGLEDAAASKKVLENAEEEKEKVLAAARKDATGIVKEAQERKASLLTQAEVAAGEKAGDILARAEKEANETKEQALTSFKQEAAELVAKSAEKLAQEGVITPQKANEVLHG